MLEQKDTLSIQESYARAVLHQIKRHAVWEPGTPLALGDFGIVTDGCFRRLGNVAQYSPPALTRKSDEQPLFEFTSEGVTTAMVSGEAEMADATLEISFGRKNALFLRASPSQLEVLDNLQELADYLQFDERWKTDWKVVTSLRSAGSFTLFFSSSSKSSLSITAKPSQLKELLVGQLSAEADVRISGEVGYKSVGGHGPIFLELARVIRNPFYGGNVRFGLEGGLPAICEVVDPNEEFADPEA